MTGVIILTGHDANEVIDLDDATEVMVLVVDEHGNEIEEYNLTGRHAPLKAKAIRDALLTKHRGYRVSVTEPD
jgi:hypothetical protein